MSINDEWNMVKEFHIASKHPISDSPTMLHKERLMQRIKWMLEEIDELKEANNIYEQADAIIDLIYFALGTLVEMGIPPKELFRIVHQANMKKVMSNNEVLTRDDGKILKPAGWTDPGDQLKEVIDSLVKIKD